MKRALLLLAVTLAVPLTAEATPLPRLSAEVPQRFTLEQTRVRLDLLLMPRGVLDEIVRWQCSFRDLVYATAGRLAALATVAQVRIPDVSVLTTEPVANTESSGFGWRDDPFRHRAKFHSGTDFRGKRGTPVLAAGDGVVRSVGWLGGYGNMVQIDHGGGVVTLYGHLQRFLVKRDEVVLAGQPIAHMGATGWTTGPHLHFEVRLDGRPVDPTMAMTIARLRRELPLAGQLASFALSPDLQSERASASDPPKQAPPKPAAPKPNKRDSRPDRPGRVKTVKPVS